MSSLRDTLLAMRGYINRKPATHRIGKGLLQSGKGIAPYQVAHFLTPFFGKGYSFRNKRRSSSLITLRPGLKGTEGRHGLGRHGRHQGRREPKGASQRSRSQGCTDD
jgi:hypothetical protein